MIGAALEATVVAAAVGVVLLLAPRSGWSVDHSSARAPWTAALSVSLTVLVSLWMSEGIEVFRFSQRWHGLALAAVISGVGGTIATTRGIVAVAGRPLISVDYNPWCLAITAMISVGLLSFPGSDGVALRIAAAVATGVGTLMLAPAASFAPRVTAITLTAAFAAMGGLLFSAGSAKVSCAAVALALLCCASSLVAKMQPSHRQGAGFAMASLVMLVAFAMYGAAYHEDGDIPLYVWWCAGFSPLAVVIAQPMFVRSYTESHGG